MSAQKQNVDPATFWDRKIIGWEVGRYDRDEKKSSLFEKFANSASSSLRVRLALARDILSENCQGKHIVEIGCGSGRIAADLIEAGAASYHGFDISPVAIDAAREATGHMSDKVRFDVSDIKSLPDIEADIVFSLGLLDWLEEADLKILFEKYKGRDFLHSYSEQRMALSQFIHRAYVFLAYGRSTGSYVPKYMKSEWLCDLSRPYFDGPIHVVRDPRLSFGAFMTSIQSSRISPSG
jgi:SAM-dependent methyltransferase